MQHQRTPTPGREASRDFTQRLQLCNPNPQTRPRRSPPHCCTHSNDGILHEDRRSATLVRCIKRANWEEGEQKLEVLRRVYIAVPKLCRCSPPVVGRAVDEDEQAVGLVGCGVVGMGIGVCKLRERCRRR
jgi:hypothetical protein